MTRCPNCGGEDSVLLGADAHDATCYLKIFSGLTHVKTEPMICLNCGIVYIDRRSLAHLKEKLGEKS